MKRALVLIPGYKGSVLKTPDTKATRWLSRKQLLSNKETMRLPLKDGNAYDPEGLVVDGVLEELPLAPFVKIDFYKKLRTAIEKALPQYDFHTIPYDWRFDMAGSLKRIHIAVEALVGQGYDEISFLTHSMGGYLLSYYLRYGADPLAQRATPPYPDKIGKVVFCGVPFRGTLYGMDYIYTERYAMGRNDRLIDKWTSMSFVVTYEIMPFLFPDSIRHYESGQAIDLSESEQWGKYHLGFLGYPEHRNQHQDYYRFIDQYLASGKSYMKKIHAEADGVVEGKFPKVLNITGTGTPTPRRFVMSTDDHSSKVLREPEANESKRELWAGTYEDGDGVVLKASAALPPAYAGTAEESSFNLEHRYLLSSKPVIQKIISFLKV